MSLEFNNGIHEFSQPIIIRDDGDTLLGESVTKTILRYTGTGFAIRVLGWRNISLSDFRLECLNPLAEGGISFEFAGNKTGWMNSIRRVEILDFVKGIGLQQTNCEQCIVEHVNIWNCMTGLVANNSTHTLKSTGGGLGMGNRWLSSRVSGCLGIGIDIEKQSAARFESVQSLKNNGKYQFWLRGGCNGCSLDIDVERKDRLGIGLFVSGTRHTIKVNAYGLKTGIWTASLTDSVILPSWYSNNVTDLFRDSRSVRVTVL